MTRNFELLISRIELIRLATLVDTQTIVGVNITEEDHSSVQAQKKEIDRRLSDLGLKAGDGIAEDYRPIFQTLFYPDRALVVIRDRPDVGKQILIFQCRRGICLVHSFPNEGWHRIALIKPIEIESMLKAWFPLPEGDHSSAPIHLSEEQLASLISATNVGEAPPPLTIMNTKSGQQLLNSLQTRKWSSSILALRLQDGQSTDAESYTIWAGEDSIWTGELHDFTGMMRLYSGREIFIGLVRMLLRNLAQLDQSVRAYRLSTEELAYSLMALNAKDRAIRVLKNSSLEITDEMWMTVAKDLKTRGLIKTSPGGYPSLAFDFEQALAPMVVPIRIGRIKTVSSQGASDGIIYLRKDRGFCAHYSPNAINVIESGTWEQLPLYLMSLFRGFGEDESHKPSRPIRISLKELTSLLEDKDHTHVEERLRATGASKTVFEKLAADLMNPVYRASIVGINPPNASATNQESVNPSVYLLKGNTCDWIFAFPDSRADSMGKGMQSNRDLLLSELMKVLNPSKSTLY